MHGKEVNVISTASTIIDTLSRFAEVEATVALSMLVRNYRIEIQVDPRFAGETFEERRSRVLAFRNILSLTPKHIPVTLTRR
jgi:hypothetical protein